MKRSRKTALVLMGMSPFLLTACDDSTDSSSRDAAYTSLEQCIQDENPRAVCESAWQSAQKAHETNSPRFSRHEECVAQFGADQCHEYHDSNGSFWGPLMTGFFVSQLLNGSQRGTYYSTPLYRDRDGRYVQPYIPGSSGGYRPSPRAGQTPVSTRPVSITPNRAITVSRSGFGSSSAARGSWGG